MQCSNLFERNVMELANDFSQCSENGIEKIINTNKSLGKIEFNETLKYF